MCGLSGNVKNGTPVYKRGIWFFQLLQLTIGMFYLLVLFAVLHKHLEYNQYFLSNCKRIYCN